MVAADLASMEQLGCVACRLLLPVPHSLLDILLMPRGELSGGQLCGVQWVMICQRTFEVMLLLDIDILWRFDCTVA